MQTTALEKLQKAAAVARGYAGLVDKGELMPIPNLAGWTERRSEGIFRHEVNNPQDWRPGCIGWVTHHYHNFGFGRDEEVEIVIRWAVA